jgi:hypothetical protein
VDDADRLRPEDAEPIVRPQREPAEREPAADGEPVKAGGQDDKQTGEGTGGWVPL